MTAVKRPIDPFKLQRSAFNGRLPGDEQCNVTFYRDAVLSPFQSAEQGEEIWFTEDFIRITVPGDSKTVIQRQISDDDKTRFHPDFYAYKEGTSENKAGLPLRQWPVVEKSVVMKFEQNNIETVEDLAGLSDSDAGSYIDGIKYRDRALAHINSVANAEKVKVAEEKENALMERIAALEAAAVPVKQGKVIADTTAK